jgi:hypothetical protein
VNTHARWEFTPIEKEYSASFLWAPTIPTSASFCSRNRPIIHYSVELAPEYKGEIINKDSLPNKISEKIQSSSENIFFQS